MEQAHHDSIFWVETDRIKPNPFQPRRDFDQQKLTELAESIKQYGLLQPITVVRKDIPLENGGWAVEYELIAGERRLRASKLAGLSQIPAIIRTKEDSDEVKLELAIIENLQREDLNPIDRALALARLVNEFGFKHIDVGKKIGRSREYVSNSIRLLQLPQQVQQLIVERKISEGHTRPLLMLTSRPEQQDVLAKEIVLKKLTVREAEGIARRIAQDRVRNPSYIQPELIEIEKDLTEKLGTRVQIEPRQVGGRLVISYFSSEDLDQIVNTMNKLGQLGIPEPLAAEIAQGVVREQHEEMRLEAAQAEEQSQAHSQHNPLPDVFADERPSVARMQEEAVQMYGNRIEDNEENSNEENPNATQNESSYHNDTYLNDMSGDDEKALEQELSADALRENVQENVQENSQASTETADGSQDEKQTQDTQTENIYSVRNFSI